MEGSGTTSATTAPLPQASAGAGAGAGAGAVDDRVQCGIEVRENEEMAISLDFQPPQSGATAQPTQAAAADAPMSRWVPPSLHVKLVELLDTDQLTISLLDPPPTSETTPAPNSLNVAMGTAPAYDVLITVGDS